MSNNDRIKAQAERYIRACAEYTAPYEREKIIANWLRKEADARGLLADFEKRAGRVAGKAVLEIGFGNGMQSVVFAKAGAHMAGLEVNETLAAIAQENLIAYDVTADFRLYDGSHMPFADGSFDYVFATSVMEHVSDVRAVAQEAARVLKKGGRFYVSFPNRWAPRETHTGYWFVNYLPRRVVQVILRAFGSDAVEELNLHFLSYFSFMRMIRGTSFVLVREEGARSLPKRIVKAVLAACGIHHSAVLKTVMLVLEKK